MEHTPAPIRQTGGCACGAVRFSTLAPKTYGACHCEMCRRWTGGVWMGVNSTEIPEVTGEVALWTSSRTATRGFCAQCGSSIWHHTKGKKIPTLGQGLFDDQTGWTRLREIFYDEKPDHYGFGGDAKAYTGWGTLWAFLTGKLSN